MNATSFVNKIEYNDIKTKTDNKETYEYEKTIKANNNIYVINISGRWHRSWKPNCNDEEYHTFLNFEYKGAQIGIGGCGGHVEFSSYEELKNEIDFLLQKYAKDDYIENNQLSLFE